MDSCRNRSKTPTASTNITTCTTNTAKKNLEHTCSKFACFFCIIEETDLSTRRAGLQKCFKEVPLMDTEELVLVLNSLWSIAMTQPDDPELPSLGIFESMAALIRKAINNKDWLHRNQNVYIPYYAAHIIGSYTMNKPELAEKAICAGVITPLLELLSGKITWVEQRVAVRALGHLASFENTFEAIANYEEEVVPLAMHISSNCFGIVYAMFVGVKDRSKRLECHRNLLTRGVGGSEMANRKAEEWASQLQCWSIHVLECFAIRERSIERICKLEFLNDLCEMWGGLMNHTSPAGVGLIRILCYKKTGRKNIAESKKVLENLCKISRSSDDWQYMGIDCLLLLVKDPDTRYKVIEIAAICLVDLIELRTLRGRSNLGEAITRTLLSDFRQSKSKIRINILTALEQIWHLKVERKVKEQMLSDEKIKGNKVMASLLKRQGNRSFWSGKIEAALEKYTEALQLCPLRSRKERIVLYSNRAQCHLLLRDPDAAISDTTRALCLSNPPNSHVKSLWRRSQAYDMKGLAKESLMDCLMFITGCIKLKPEPTNHVNIPYYAVHMISKQMELTGIFRAAQLKLFENHAETAQESKDESSKSESPSDEAILMKSDRKCSTSNLSTILEDPFMGKDGNSRRNQERARRRKKNFLARSM